MAVKSAARKRGRGVAYAEGHLEGWRKPKTRKKEKAEPTAPPSPAGLPYPTVPGGLWSTCTPYYPSNDASYSPDGSYHSIDADIEYAEWTGEDESATSAIDPVLLDEHERAKGGDEPQDTFFELQGQAPDYNSAVVGSEVGTGLLTFDVRHLPYDRLALDRYYPEPPAAWKVKTKLKRALEKDIEATHSYLARLRRLETLKPEVDGTASRSTVCMEYVGPDIARAEQWLCNCEKALEPLEHMRPWSVITVGDGPQAALA
ncbi:hypothetical protein LTR36_009678 [Oleoguttula mirabilis]|uniref:Uncharacterized protein n=1 Tax=Oleoguttula mirabilis TaxID=1507867 RepID=A0AAV9J678_9PEZI|nr:hypothetical protein LTR36_009678 [Oleoguttula mirabilis]